MADLVGTREAGRSIRLRVRARVFRAQLLLELWAQFDAELDSMFCDGVIEQVNILTAPASEGTF